MIIYIFFYRLINPFVLAKLPPSDVYTNPVYGFYADKDNLREDSPMNRKTLT